MNLFFVLRYRCLGLVLLIFLGFFRKIGNLDFYTVVFNYFIVYFKKEIIYGGFLGCLGGRRIRFSLEFISSTCRMFSLVVQFFLSTLIQILSLAFTLGWKILVKKQFLGGEVGKFFFSRSFMRKRFLAYGVFFGMQRGEIGLRGLVFLGIL